MDKCFSMLLTTVSCCKWCQIRLGPCCIWCPTGNYSRSLVILLHINDITADTESEIRLFADACVCYREIKDKEDTLKLQRDIDRLGNWARKWGMKFQPVKCNMMQLTRKHLNKIQASYTLEGTVLEYVDNIKYLGVTTRKSALRGTYTPGWCPFLSINIF